MKGADSMKLSADDKQYLINCGYLEKDIPQIEKVISVIKYTEIKDGKRKRVPRKYVLENMERTEWLSGISRAAFHWTAMRETRNGTGIYFDASKFFEN